MDQTHRGKEQHEQRQTGQEFGHVHQVQEREHHDHEIIGHEKEHVQLAGQLPRPADKQSNHDAADDQHVTLYLDNTPYKTPSCRISGADLRKLANPPISADKRIFRTIPGDAADVGIGDADIVEVNPRDVNQGRHFYSVSTACASERKHSDIAKKAYEIYLKAGRPQGRAEEHWLQAEAQYDH